jgi:hypothetical protein
MAAKIHDLKSWPEFFGPVLEGRKTFELRKNDRNFMVGDILWLREWEPRTAKYSGREIRKREADNGPGQTKRVAAQAR